jgi:hypothetical protein
MVPENNELRSSNGYVNSVLISSHTFFFSLIFQSLGRSIDGLSDTVVPSGDRAEEASVDAVQAHVIGGLDDR